MYARSALCATILILGAGCDSGESVDADADVEWQGETVVAAHVDWVSTTAETDPFDHRPAEIECPDFGALTEDGVFEVLTDVCSYGTFSQSLPVELRPGDTVIGTIWHLQLWAPEQTQGHVALAIGDTLIWEATPTIPGREAVYPIEWPVDRIVPAGTPVYYHVHNHGSNSWRVLDITATRP